MKWTIDIPISFEASHKLNGLKPGHKCEVTHGHSYEAVISLEARILDSSGFLFDASEIKNPLKKLLDHKDLNDAMDSMNPTAENIAWFIAQVVTGILLKFDAQEDVKVVKVVVREGKGLSATLEL